MSPVTSLQPMGVQVALQAESQKAQIELIKAQTNSIKADTMKKVTADMFEPDSPLGRPKKEGSYSPLLCF